MSAKQVKEPQAPYDASVADLRPSLILERDGVPMAALISIEEYEQYRALAAERQRDAKREARRAADRAVFGDLVGCALASGDPGWIPSPEPHWRVPYRSFDGALVATVAVDARTLAVSLTGEERTGLLERVAQLAAASNA